MNLNAFFPCWNPSPSIRGSAFLLLVLLSPLVASSAVLPPTAKAASAPGPYVTVTSELEVAAGLNAVPGPGGSLAYLYASPATGATSAGLTLQYGLQSAYRLPNLQTRPAGLQTRLASPRPSNAHSETADVLRQPDPEDQPIAGATSDTIPDPVKVMSRSAMAPGWGQAINQQYWKIPVVYGLLGGLTWYSMHMHDRYTDFRAAFYNLGTDNDDERFGPTPGYIDPTMNPDRLREQRDFFRNRRDFTFVAIFLAYGLNVVDAYVFAHFRDFDVSDDLSANMRVKPFDRMGDLSYPSVSLNLSFR